MIPEDEHVITERLLRSLDELAKRTTGDSVTAARLARRAEVAVRTAGASFPAKPQDIEELRIRLKLVDLPRPAMDALALLNATANAPTGDSLAATVIARLAALVLERVKRCGASFDPPSDEDVRRVRATAHRKVSDGVEALIAEAT